MTVQVREFQPGDETAFKTLNEAWISAYFKLEEKDISTLGDPRQHILDRGGHIYLAVDRDSGETLGCCALIAMKAGVFEVAKMAVAENLRGRGIGRVLLRGVIDAARDLGAIRLYIETNHTLQNAIALYRSEGFEHLRPEDVEPSPYARADVYMQMAL